MELGFALVRAALGLSVAPMARRNCLAGWRRRHHRNRRLLLRAWASTPERAFAVVAGLGEFCGGLLMALGLLGPIGPALIVCVMCAAIFTRTSATDSSTSRAD